MCDDAKSSTVRLVYECRYHCIRERWDLRDKVVNDDLDGVHFRAREFPHYLPRPLLTLYFPSVPLTAERVVSANRSGRVAVGGRRRGAGDQQAWPDKLPALQAITELDDVWQRIGRRSDGRYAMAEETGHDCGQGRPLKVSQR